MRLFLASLLTLAVVALAAPAQKGAKEAKFVLSGENTKVEFVGRKPEGKHEGGFKEMSGTATAKGTDVKSLKIRLEIDTESLFSDDPKLTAHLKAPDFFNVKKHPKATFVSEKVEKTPKGYTISGKLDMLNETKPVSLTARVTLTDKKLELSSEFKIDRTDWGMTTGKGKIDDEVSLTVQIDAKR